MVVFLEELVAPNRRVDQLLSHIFGRRQAVQIIFWKRVSRTNLRRL